MRHRAMLSSSTSVYYFLLGDMMNLLDLLRTDTHIISVVGSGGKSTLIEELASELSCTAIIATTTHMFAPNGLPVLVGATEADIKAALQQNSVICTGMWADRPGAKLCKPRLGFPTLARLASCVLVEADGSRRLPLKAHSTHEPVLAEGTDETIQLIGASGFGKPVSETVHRPELFCELVGCDLHDICTPELYARCIATEHASRVVCPDIIVINQVDNDRDMASAKRFFLALRAQKDMVEVVAGSLHRHYLARL